MSFEPHPKNKKYLQNHRKPEALTSICNLYRLYDLPLLKYILINSNEHRNKWIKTDIDSFPRLFSNILPALNEGYIIQNSLCNYDYTHKILKCHLAIISFHETIQSLHSFLNNSPQRQSAAFTRVHFLLWVHFPFIFCFIEWNKKLEDSERYNSKKLQNKEHLTHNQIQWVYIGSVLKTMIYLNF